MERARELASQTLMLGALGGSLGGLGAYLRGASPALGAMAFSVNSMIAGAAYLATREAALTVGGLAPVPASALAGGFVGFVSTSIISGARRGAMGALLWAAVASSGSAAFEAVTAARAAAAADAAERARLWQALSAQQREAFFARAATMKGVEGRPVWSASHAATGEPPPTVLGDMLRDAANVAGVETAESSKRRVMQSMPMNSVASDQALATRRGSSVDAGDPRGILSWLPFHWGADAEEHRLARLRARLVEVEELLGERPPPPPTHAA